MERERIPAIGRFALFAVIHVALILGLSSGNDPFQGNFPTLKCIKLRLITGCNGTTFVDVYLKSNHSHGDQNINSPNTTFYLYTRRNKECAEPLHKCGGTLPTNTNFDANKITILIVGGYISGVCVFAYFRELKDQFLCRGDYNIILVDWSWGFYPDIHSSFVNARVVGKQMAFFALLLMEQTGISPNNIYFIGHSVGAHIAGQAGSYFSLISGGQQIWRIIALDPSGAGHSTAGEDQIVDRSDARHVDVIYSNAGKCFPAFIGMDKPTGHATFYVNGGQYQPSCIPLILHDFLKGNVIKAFASFFLPLCFHFQSIEFFKASINHCGCQFIGVECGSREDFLLGKCRSCGENGTRCAVMGWDWEHCPHPEEPRIYYVKTTNHCPYCDPKAVDLQGYQCSELNTKRCCTLHANSSSEICIKDT